MKSWMTALGKPEATKQVGVDDIALVLQSWEEITKMEWLGKVAVYFWKFQILVFTCSYEIEVNYLFFLKFIYFIYLFLAALGLCCCTWAFSSCSHSGGYSSLWCVGFSLRWLLLLRSTGTRREGFSSCGARAQQLWRTGLVAPRHVGFSWSRARTCVPCVGRRILNHCATREAPSFFFFFYILIGV